MSRIEPASKRIAIIGATSRVGRAVAAEFAELGWSLELTARDPDRIETSHGSSSSGSSVEIRRHALDLADAAAVDRAVASIGGVALDAVVVAGAPFDETSLADATAEDFASHAAAQGAGPARLVAGLRSSLGRSESPAIVLFGDVHAWSRPRAGATPYLVAKAGVEAMVGLLAVELAPVRVFGLSPGVVGWPDGWPDARREAYLERVPLERAGTPEETASLVRALVLDATYCTGVVIPIDGGRHLR